MLKIDNTVLLLIDYQEKLFPTMHAKEELTVNLRKLISGSKILGLPILLTEQYPDGLGPTIDEAQELLENIEPISKMCFGSCGSDAFMAELKRLNRKAVLIAGIETHICVYQTVAGLLQNGYTVDIVADACSSRTPENKKIGLKRCRDLGATITSVETALFELMRVAEGPQFKEILKIVK